MIIAPIAGQDVLPGTSRELIVAATTVEIVVTAIPGQVVLAGATRQAIVAGPTVKMVVAVAAVDPIVPVAGADDVVAAAAVDRVIPAETHDHIRLFGAGQPVIAVGADDRRLVTLTARDRARAPATTRPTGAAARATPRWPPPDPPAPPSPSRRTVSRSALAPSPIWPATTILPSEVKAIA